MPFRSERTGVADLWLAAGGVPHYREMVALAGPVARALVEEHGTTEFLKRLSNPLWFSCLAAALGFEWNTSGQSTVTVSALKQALEKEEIGVRIVGGKGLKAKAVPKEIVGAGEALGLSDKKIQETRYASKMAANVDSSALHDLRGQIYFHAMAVDEKAEWAVIQQKMAPDEQKARRYHWLSTSVKDFVEEPHSGILGSRQEIVLDLTARQARTERKAIVELAGEEKPKKINEELWLLRTSQTRLTDFTKKFPVIKRVPFLEPPTKVSEKVMERVRELSPKNFEQFLGVPGVGPATVRGLSYVASLLYGTEPSWKDPARYEWAFGTKSGSPFYGEGGRGASARGRGSARGKI